jgi:hypothetical protein
MLNNINPGWNRYTYPYAASPLSRFKGQMEKNVGIGSGRKAFPDKHNN